MPFSQSAVRQVLTGLKAKVEHTFEFIILRHVYGYFTVVIITKVLIGSLGVEQQPQYQRWDGIVVESTVGSLHANKLLSGSAVHKSNLCISRTKLA